MTRREMLQSAAGWGLAAICGSQQAQAHATGELPATQMTGASLRDTAAARGVLFGAAVPWQEISAAPAFAKVVAQQCGILAPEIELKWKALRPSPDAFDFRAADQLYEFAHTHGMLFRGHTLVWEAALPDWFATTVNARNARHFMLRHISTVVSHFAGRTHSWDVVNEPFQLEDGRADGLKVTPWLRFVGAEYIEMAFHAAHQADPNALLVLNENWLEPENSAAEDKRQAVLAFLTQLRRKRVPVHGLGVQSHLVPELPNMGAGFRRFLQAVEDLGMTIVVSELDVRDQSLPADVQVRDQNVASQYERYVDFMLQFKSVKTVLTWGLSDRFTWLAKNHPRADGLHVRPLLFDYEMRPKPAFDAVLRTFKQASTVGDASPNNNFFHHKLRYTHV